MKDLMLGELVEFTGTMKKIRKSWDRIYYETAGLPYFAGYKWKHGPESTYHYRTQGVVVGKRHYVSMRYDEGLWYNDQKQEFTGYLIAYDMSRRPIIVSEEQIKVLKEES